MRETCIDCGANDDLCHCGRCSECDDRYTDIMFYVPQVYSDSAVKLW